MFKAWELAAIDSAGYNGIRNEHIKRVADEIRASGLTFVDDRTFRRICERCFIDPDNFTKEDIEKLERELN